MPEDNKAPSKSSKFQLQFHCKMVLISHDQRAGFEPPPCRALARGPVALLPSLFNKPLLSAHPERGPNPKTSTTTPLRGRKTPAWLGSSNARAEPRIMLPSKQLLPLKLEGNFWHKHPWFAQTSQDHRKGFGAGCWMSEEKQKRMKLHDRGLANSLRGLGHTLLKHWVQGFFVFLTTAFCSWKEVLEISRLDKQGF